MDGHPEAASIHRAKVSSRQSVADALPKVHDGAVFAGMSIGFLMYTVFSLIVVVVTPVTAIVLFVLLRSWNSWDVTGGPDELKAPLAAFLLEGPAC